MTYRANYSLTRGRFFPSVATDGTHWAYTHRKMPNG